MNSTMKPTAVFVLFVLIQFMSIQVAKPDGVQKANTQLTANSPVHCDKIIEVSDFEGDCCSLNVTDGNGCVLNVVNGRCIVKGQYWTLDYESTLTKGGVQCPPGEYQLGTTEFPTMAPLSGAATTTSFTKLLSIVSVAFIVATASVMVI